MIRQETRTSDCCSRAPEREGAQYTVLDMTRFSALAALSSLSLVLVTGVSGLAILEESRLQGIIASKVGPVMVVTVSSQRPLYVGHVESFASSSERHTV